MKPFDAILYDLDGTLIHLPQDRMVADLTSGLALSLSPKLGVGMQQFVFALSEGIEAMIGNTGAQTNRDVFLQTASMRLCCDRDAIEKHFNDFYLGEYNRFASLTSVNRFAKKALELSHKLAHRVILATLPIFPYEAQKARLSWIGLTHGDFDLVTDYSNCSHAKPNPDYYREILDKFSLDPARCMMVGNDVSDDILPTLSLGMQSYLVTDCLLNGHLAREGAKESDFETFTAYLERL